MSFRREELLRIGGFDTRFSGSAYREDTDVSIRIGSRRGRIIFCPSASLTHHEVPSGGCHVADVVGETRDISWEVNNFLFYLKNLPRHRLLPIAFVHVLSAIKHGNGPRGVLKRASRSWLAFRRAQEISTTDPLLVRSAPIS
jgi:GT2 family glycosyltransferase